MVARSGPDAFSSSKGTSTGSRPVAASRSSRRIPPLRRSVPAGSSYEPATDLFYFLAHPRRCETPRTGSSGPWTARARSPRGIPSAPSPTPPRCSRHPRRPRRSEGRAARVSASSSPSTPRSSAPGYRPRRRRGPLGEQRGRGTGDAGAGRALRGGRGGPRREPAAEPDRPQRRDVHDVQRTSSTRHRRRPPAPAAAVVARGGLGRGAGGGVGRDARSGREPRGRADVPGGRPGGGRLHLGVAGVRRGDGRGRRGPARARR